MVAEKDTVKSFEKALHLPVYVSANQHHLTFCKQFCVPGHN